jgi:hypothetical protein
MSPLNDELGRRTGRRVSITTGVGDEEVMRMDGMGRGGKGRIGKRTGKIK